MAEKNLWQSFMKKMHEWHLSSPKSFHLRSQTSNFFLKLFLTPFLSPNPISTKKNFFNEAIIVKSEKPHLLALLCW